MSYKITEDCVLCEKCADECPIKAIKRKGDLFIIEQEFCVECEACRYLCDADAIVIE